MANRERETAMFHNAGPLFAIAREAHGRITAAERSPGQYDAIVAVVFSALAIEAMLTELYLMARVGRLPLPSSVETMATLLREAEESRASLGLKLQLFSPAIRGVLWDEGGAPYQDFIRLVDLRNALVHTKADRIDSTGLEPPKAVVRLRSTGVLADQEPARSWIEIVGTKAAARWACESASLMANAMVNALPEGEFRDTARVVFWQILGAPG